MVVEVVVAVVVLAEAVAAAVVVVVVVLLEGSEVSGEPETEGAGSAGTEPADGGTVGEVAVVPVPGAGGKGCASTTLPDGADVVVAVPDGTAAVVSDIVSGADADVPDSLSLPEEQDAASKTVDNAIAM